MKTCWFETDLYVPKFDELAAELNLKCRMLCFLKFLYSDMSLMYFFLSNSSPRLPMLPFISSSSFLRSSLSLLYISLCNSAPTFPLKSMSASSLSLSPTPSWFILPSSHWTPAKIPSQVVLQLKLRVEFASMQSLPFGLHFLKSCKTTNPILVCLDVFKTGNTW